MLPAFVLAGEEEHSILIPAIPDLIWGTVSFVVVLAVIVWKVLPNVNKALDARRDAIEGSLARAEEAQAAAAASRSELEAALADARAEAARIRDAARGDAEKIRAEILAAAELDAARVREQGIAQLEAERAAAVASLRGEVGTLALDLAGRVIGETLSEDQKATALVDRFLADLEASEKVGK